MRYNLMCNHCQSHEADEKFKAESHKVFLSSLAETSSQISKMNAGILAKDMEDSFGIVSFGPFQDVLAMSSKVSMSVLKIALEKAKSEKDIQLAFMLFNQVNDMANELKGFVAELDKVTDEIKSSAKEG